MTNIVLVGVPDSIKTQIADAIETAGEGDIIRVWDNIYNPSTFAIGSLSDYRKELSIALSRAMYDYKGSNHILKTHSLIDSLAYATVRYKLMVESGSVTEDELYSWWITLNCIGRVFRDTFKADLVYRVVRQDTGNINDAPSYFNTLLSEAHEAIISNFKIDVPKTILVDYLPSDESYAKLGQQILEDINGPGTNTEGVTEQEPEQQHV